MAAKIPQMVGTVDVLLGNLEDAVKADNKVAAREGLVRIAQDTADFGGSGSPTQLWTRINALDSPWVLDDLTTLVPAIGDKLDVIMVPKVQGAEDIHYVDRLLAQLEAKAGLTRPILVHAILETARGVVERRGDLRRQPAHAGPLPRPGRPRRRPPDEDHPGRRRPPRLPRPRGPQPGPAGRAPHDLPAGPLALHDRPDGRRLRDARHLPLLRPVRRHRRRGRLRGPVPQRLPARLRRHLDAAPQADRDRQPGLQPQRRGHHARPPRGRRDGRRHRRGDARRQDGGRRLAQAVPGDGRSSPRSSPRSTPSSRSSTTRSTTTRARTTHEHDRVPAPPLGPLHAELQRARAGEGQDHPVRRADPRPRGRRRPRRQAGRPRGRLRGGPLRRVRPARGHHPRQRRRHRVARRRPGRRVRRRPGRDRRAQGQQRRRGPRAGRGDGGARRPGAHHAVGDGRDAVRHPARRGDRRRLRPAHRPRDGHQRPRQGAVRRARARPRAAADRPRDCRCWPPGRPAR